MGSEGVGWMSHRVNALLRIWKQRQRRSEENSLATDLIYGISCMQREGIDKTNAFSNGR